MFPGKSYDAIGALFARQLAFIVQRMQVSGRLPHCKRGLMQVKLSFEHDGQNVGGGLWHHAGVKHFF